MWNEAKKLREIIENIFFQKKKKKRKKWKQLDFSKEAKKILSISYRTRYLCNIIVDSNACLISTWYLKGTGQNWKFLKSTLNSARDEHWATHQKDLQDPANWEKWRRINKKLRTLLMAASGCAHVTVRMYEKCNVVYVLTPFQHDAGEWSRGYRK